MASILSVRPMSITPRALAQSFRRQADKRATVTVTSELVVREGEIVTFRVHDSDGGILHVVVSQYKEPIR